MLFRSDVANTLVYLRNWQLQWTTPERKYEITRIVDDIERATFKSNDEQMGEPLNSEREKLWEIFDGFSMQETEPNSIVVPSIISGSAHTFKLRGLL